MSAIYGIYHFQGRAVAPDHMSRMADVLSYRGPDGQGQWIDGQIGLGHLMLQTTPESRNEKLPAHDPAGNLVLTADARIDNRDELMILLAIPACEQSNLTDSGLILKAYEKWEQECVSHIVGDFAFALWDRRRQHLFCARDHMGKKPFYFCRRSNFFAFASTINALLTIPGVSSRFNEERLALAIMKMSLADDYTLYEDICELQPAHLMMIAPGRKSVRRYWDIVSLPKIRLESDEAYVEGFRDIFAKVVRSHLRSVRPVGLFLSGGLDSGAAACVAARHMAESGQTLHSFAFRPLQKFDLLLPENVISDETPYVEAIARGQSNIDVTYCRAEGKSPLDYLGQTCCYLARPMQRIANLHWLANIHELMRQKGIGVVLNGANGNHTASWEGMLYFSKLAGHGRWLQLLREAKAFSAPRPMTWKNILSLATPPSFKGIYRRWRREKEFWLKLSPINPQFARRIFGNGPVVSEYLQSVGIKEFLPIRSYMQDGFYRRSLKIHGPMLDALSTYYGMEPRDPFADRRLMEFCLKIPVEQYFRGGKDRLLIRRAMEGILPPEVQWRKNRSRQWADVFLRLSDAINGLHQFLDKLENSDQACQYLNVNYIRQVSMLLKNGNPDPKDIQIINMVLIWGLSIGGFLLWHEDRRKTVFSA